MVSVAYALIIYTVLHFFIYLLFSSFGNWAVLKLSPHPKPTNNTKLLAFEIRQSLISSFAFGLIATTLMASPVSHHFRIYYNVNEYSYLWLALSLPAMLLTHDIHFYLSHRFMHKFKFLRWAHNTHHKTVHPISFSCFSLSFAEAFWTQLWTLPFLFFFPVHINILTLVVFIGIIVNITYHLGQDPFPKNLHKVFLLKYLNRPRYHSYHHQDAAFNFGYYTVFWDKISGTFLETYKEEA